MKKWKTQRRYLRNFDRTPVGMIVTRFEAGSPHALFWWSLCDKTDKFSKKKGFEIAIGRKPIYFNMTQDNKAFLAEFPGYLQPVAAALVLDLIEYNRKGAELAKTPALVS